MRSRITLSLAILVTTIVPASGRAESDQTTPASIAALNAYESDARELVEVIETAPVDDDEPIASRAHALMSKSRDILGDFAILYPPCGPYFAATFLLQDRLETISIEELESDYHADGRLPSAPVFCYHAKDFYVHPASVIVLLRVSGTRPQMAAEIKEALAHVAVARSLMSAPADVTAPARTRTPTAPDR